MQAIRTGAIAATLILLAFVILGCGSGASYQPVDGDRLVPPLPPAAGIGVMVLLDGGTYMRVGDGFDALEDKDALGAFSNTFSGVIECFDQNAAPCPTQDAPPPPAPDPAETHKAVDAQACTFFNGGILLPSAYTQVIYVSPEPYDFTYKAYHYHYDIIPIINPVLPDLDQDDIVRLSGQLSIEQVMFPDPGFPMYAFITEGLTQDLRLYVDGSPVPVMAAVAHNCAGCRHGEPGSLDFSFFPSVGTSGDAMDAVKSGDARSILNSDHYADNDDGGSSGSVLQRTDFYSGKLDLSTGEHTVLFTGIAAGTSFQVSTTLRILEQGCSSP